MRTRMRSGLPLADTGASHRPILDRLNRLGKGDDVDLLLLEGDSFYF